MGIQRIFLIIVGWISIVLATLGLLLALLPTTPFLLLAAWCFARSSPRFHYWLLYNSWFREYIRRWQQHKALLRGVKIKLIFILVNSGLVDSRGIVNYLRAISLLYIKVARN